MELMKQMDINTALSDKRYFFHDLAKLPEDWRCDWERFNSNKLFLLRTADGRLSLNIELEAIYQIPRGAIISVVFYDDLFVFRCSGRFYVWEFTNGVLYEFMMEFASDSIDDFLSHDAIQAWMAGTLPSTLVVQAVERLVDNAVIEEKEMEWGKLQGFPMELDLDVTDEEIDNALGEEWAALIRSHQ